MWMLITVLAEVHSHYEMALRCQESHISALPAGELHDGHGTILEIPLSTGLCEIGRWRFVSPPHRTQVEIAYGFPHRVATAQVQVGVMLEVLAFMNTLGSRPYAYCSAEKRLSQT